MDADRPEAEEPTELQPTGFEPTELEPTELQPTELEPIELEPTDSLTREPPLFEAASPDALTPMGQVDAIGAFARGLGPRRLRIGLAIGAGLVMLLAVLAAL